MPELQTKYFGDIHIVQMNKNPMIPHFRHRNEVCSRNEVCIISDIEMRYVAASAVIEIDTQNNYRNTCACAPMIYAHSH